VRRRGSVDLVHLFALDRVSSPHEVGTAIAPRRRLQLIPASLGARLNRLFLVAIFVVGGITTVSTLSIVNLLHARHSLLGEIDPASLAVDQLEIAYVDQETGVRGYALSHNTAFLEPTAQGLVAQKTDIAAIDRSLRRNDPLYNLVHAAEKQAYRWQVEYAQPTIRSTAQGSDAYGTKASLERGKRLFDEIRARFEVLDRALMRNRAVYGDDLTHATVILIVALGFGLLLVIGAGILLNRALHNWVLQPLAHLGLDSRRVAFGDLSTTIEPAGPTEVHNLGVDIENMRMRIVSELQESARARDELHQSNFELERSNLELEQFAFVASHDLQEPLRKVTSFVQLLQERYGHEFDERADQYIEFAVDGAKRMQQLINDLLAFSRVGRTSEAFTDMAMSECVAGAIENLDVAVADAKAIFDIGELPTVHGDRVLLTSLWQNLIGNSIKFRSQTPPHIRITAQKEGNESVFSITDNGIGIEPRFADKVFVIFQRLHGRQSYEGTGIGLSLSKKIAEFHGGRMWLDSSVTTGTRIYFTLPATYERELN
jgi:signal transduction histidine kinase